MYIIQASHRTAAKEEECDGDLVYNACGPGQGGCEAHCGYRPSCTKIKKCDPGCYCPRGLIRSEMGSTTCIKRKDCPKCKIDSDCALTNQTCDWGYCITKKELSVDERCKEKKCGESCIPKTNAFGACDDNQQCVYLNDHRGCKDGGKPGPPCEGPPEYGMCIPLFHGFTFDPVSKTCKQTEISGCGRTNNGFLKLEECEEKCERNSRKRPGENKDPWIKPTNRI